MIIKARAGRTLWGSFAIHGLGSNVWRLATGDCAAPEIYFIGAESGAGCIEREMNISAVTLEWRDRDVHATLISIGGPKSLHARAALIHEPCAELYRSLPLAQFDGAARRFWRQIFWLIRIPGGRHLLRFMARGGCKS